VGHSPEEKFMVIFSENQDPISYPKMLEGIEFKKKYSLPMGMMMYIRVCIWVARTKKYDIYGIYTEFFRYL
jgi:hypothetical protein